MKRIKVWVEAMRLRTLPVSVAGVFGGTACAIALHGFRWLPALLCLLFAILAQIASNFANEYYDYRDGLDKKGREGFRRGVTEGDISPEAMKRATYGILAVDALIGCSLIIWGGWWLIAIGAAIGLFAIGYSAGPWPLSRHGLGDIAVILFFGIVPVMFTCYVQTGIWSWSSPSLLTGIAIGLLGANVLIVNNYRDMEDDKAVGKHTTVVIFGRPAMANAYIIGAIIALTLLAVTFYGLISPLWMLIFPVFAVVYILLNIKLRKSRGAALNPLLGKTAMTLLAVSFFLLLACAIG